MVKRKNTNKKVYNKPPVANKDDKLLKERARKSISWEKLWKKVGWQGLGVVVALLVSILSFYQSGRVEKEKKMNEIDKYRYTNLCELLQNWDKYDRESNKQDEKDEKLSIPDLAVISIKDDFFGCWKRYDVAKPFLDAEYKSELDDYFHKGRDLLFDILMNEKEREEMVELLKSTFNSNDNEEVYELLTEKLQPMQREDGEILFGIDIKRKELQKEFSKTVAGSGLYLREIIEKQIDKLLKK